MAGGIDWFRWHHGSVTDPKFALVAKNAGARFGDVITVWAFLLEAASADCQRGAIGSIDHESVDFMLGAEAGTAARVIEAMEQRGLIFEGRIASWEKRQPKRERDDDLSTERVRAFRSTKRQETPGNTEERQETPRVEDSREDIQKDKPSVERAPKRASRKCPQDFSVTDEMRSWAADKVSHVDVDGETAKFADHTFRTAITDWPGAWRNWLRKAGEFVATRGPPATRSFDQQRIDEKRDAVAKWTGGILGRQSSDNIIDMEVVNAHKRLG